MIQGRIMKIRTLLLFILLPLTTLLHAQRHCSTHAHHEKMLVEDAQYRTNRMVLSNLIPSSRSYKTDSAEVPAVITIPVVVHVLYNKFDDSLTDAQILSQIDVLNRDFRLLSEETANIPSYFKPVAADCNIQFVLAKRKPDSTATNGINRKFTSRISFSDNNDMKFAARGGIDAWNSTEYLNIWVCRLANNILGYAQLPGGTAKSDGVVINQSAFGTMGTAKYPFNKGRTTTHEIGHWLNLGHIWGDKTDCTGNDLVEDTPPQGAPTFGAPKTVLSSCNNTTMYMNFMDYTDDAAMSMFTEGQAIRMRNLFEEGGVRHSLLSSKALLAPIGSSVDNPIVYNIPCAEKTEGIFSRSKAKSIHPGGFTYGQINGKGKVDWFEFNNTVTQNNIQIVLTDLVADFDVTIYDENGLMLGRSRRAGTRQENIKLNGAKVGTYYVKVQGYKGAVAQQCYALYASISKSAFKTDEESNDIVEPQKPEEIVELSSRLYPNPSTGATNLDVYLTEEEAGLEVALYDMMGAKVKEMQFASLSGFNSLNLELNDVQGGIYNFIAKSGDAVFHQRLVLSR